jgi:ABC-2 type transport system ATP-binding protein
MSGFSVQAQGLSVRYGETTALDAVDLELAPGRIHGLLGRNGSGKTTLLSTMAALRRPSAGTLLVDGEDPLENERVMGGVCLVRESGDVMATEKIADNFDLLAALRPSWDGDYAEALLEQFELTPDDRPNALSHGQRSALGAVIGLATRAPLTVFDETYLGMDAPSRYRFYDELIADYAEHPRTVVVSTHLISEVERLFESVLVLHRGRVLLREDIDELRSKGVTVTAAQGLLDGLTLGLPVLAERELGHVRQLSLFGELDPDLRGRLTEAGAQIDRLTVQDLFVELTEGAAR